MLGGASSSGGGAGAALAAAMARGARLSAGPVALAADGTTYREQLDVDRAFLAWAESPAGRAQIAMELKALRSSAAARLVRDMLVTAEGKEGLLKGLQQALAGDSALPTQLRAMLQQLN